MRPSITLIKLLSGFCFLGLIIFVARVFDTSHTLAGAGGSLVGSSITRVPIPGEQSINETHFIVFLWWLALAVILLIAMIDLWLARHRFDITVKRHLPKSLALGAFEKITLTVINNSSRHLRIKLTELHTDSLDSSQLPLEFSIAGQSTKSIDYNLLPTQRGEASFTSTWLRITSGWGFWLVNQKIDNFAQLKIYPNFAPIAQSAGATLEHHIAKMGIHLQQRRGEGSDFHQLREFREGDSMRQIDWNATSRHHKPVSRDYQDERDQEVFFLLDCGRALRGKEDELSFFDHALNAVLLTSYVALRQGDGVGLMTFGTEQQRWLAPLKNPANINVIMNQLYDLQSTTQASDFLEVAQNFLQRRKKRALVIIISSIRDSDIDNLKAATQLLSRQHMVMIASLRDRYFDEKITQPVENLNSALAYCAIVDYLKKQTIALAKLKQSGIITADSPPSLLHLNLVQEYLRLKKSGRF